MSFLSGFAGAASQTYDEGIQRWKALFQEDEKLKENRRQFELEHDLRKDEVEAENRRWESDFNWRVELGNMQNDLARDQFDNTRLNSYYTNVTAQLPDMPPEQRLEMYGTFMETFGNDPIGGALGNLLEAQISSIDYISRAEAIGGLNAVLNTPPGTLVFNPLVDSYFEALTEEEQAQYKPMFDAWKSGNTDDWEQFANTAQQLDALAVSEMESEIALRDAQTAATNAEAFVAIGKYNMEVDEHDINMGLLTNALALSEDEVARSSIDTEFYPATAAARARSVIATATTDEARARVANGTVQAQIDTIVAGRRQAIAEAGLTEEDLRYNLATAGIRETALQLNNENIEASTAQIRAYINTLDESVLDSQFKREQAAFDMVAAIVEGGSVELLDAVGEDMLRIAFGDEWETIRDDLSDRAFSQRDTMDRLAMASIIFEENRADEMRQSAETYMDRYQDTRDDVAFNQDLANRELELRNRGLELDERRVRVMEKESAWNMAFNEKKWSAEVRDAATGTPRNELFNLVADATGIDQGELATYGATATELNGLATNLSLLADAYENDPSNVQALVEGVTPLLTEYGIDTMLLQDAASIGIAAEFVRNSIASNRDQFVRSAGIFMSNAAGLGVAVTPEDLGLNLSLQSDLDLWGSINLQNGAVRAQFGEWDEGYEEISVEMNAVLNGFAPSLLVDGTAVVTAETVEAVYNAAVEATSVEELQAAGINGPADMTSRVRAAANQYQATRDTIEGYEPQLSTWGITMDYSDPEVVNAAASSVATRVGQANDIQSGIARLPAGPDMLGQVQDALFRPGSMFNPGEPRYNEVDPVVHEGYLNDVQSTYGIPSSVLMQEGFVRNVGGNSLIIDPVGLATYLQNVSSEWGDIADALQTYNSRY